MKEGGMAGNKDNLVMEGDALIGTILVRNGYLTEGQLKICLAKYGNPANRLLLGEIAVAEGFVGKEIVERAIKRREAYLAEKRRADEAEVRRASIAPPPVPHPATPGDPQTLLKWLAGAIKNRMSDLHVKSGEPLIARINGCLVKMKTNTIDRVEAERILLAVLRDEEKAELEKNQSVNIILALPEGGRARGSIYRHFRGIDGAFRLIPKEVPTLTSLNLPTILAKFTTYAQGLVLVTGPAGSGKSTTLAALVNIINQDRKCHIITVEEPIEFVHPCQKSLVTERQVGVHTQDVSAALRAALREDPDVIVVGEMRDTETAQLTITAAETGHLVFATLHTNNAVRSVNRVVDMFPPEEQPQIRTMLSESLRGVLSQRLVMRRDGGGRLPIVEIMFSNTAIANLVRDKKTYQLPNIIKISKDQGSITLDDYARKLVQTEQISQEVLSGLLAE
jgi:twitching motility protein PilT